MRLVTWNINGVRSFKSSGGGLSAKLAELSADIVLLQEHKCSPSAITTDICIVHFWALAGDVAMLQKTL